MSIFSYIALMFMSIHNVISFTIIINLPVPMHFQWISKLLYSLYCTKE